MRWVVLDTETTGLSADQGDRLVEVGCVEIVNRQLTGNDYHTYCCPERDMPEEAYQVHGLSEAFLSDKPLFKTIAADLMDYLQGATLIIHNAAFDLGFLDKEFELCGACVGYSKSADVIDSLSVAREKHPGQRNTLDALCKRYHIDLSERKLHGALLDARLLADVYLAMTGGQGALFASATQQVAAQTSVKQSKHAPLSDVGLVVTLSESERQAHSDYIHSLGEAAQKRWASGE